jgi:hypothetical protein
MYKNATKCNETIGKWCKNKHGASKIIDTFETYHPSHILVRHPFLHIPTEILIFIISFVFLRSLATCYMSKKFTRENDVSVEFHPFDVFVKDRATKDVLLRGQCRRGFYALDVPTVSQVFTGIRLSSSLCH